MKSLSKAEFAWPGGDVPGDLDFRYEPSAQITGAISRALAPSFPPAGAADACYGALTPPEGPIGRYRLSTEEGAWFVRVSSRRGNLELEKAIIHYLSSRGVNVNPYLIASETLTWNGLAFRIDVRPLIDARHFNGSTKDLQNLASALADCHRALRDFPRAGQVRSSSATRVRRLAEIRDRIDQGLEAGNFQLFAELTPWASAHTDWLTEMVERFVPHLGECSDAQCVHGEVHPANVLFRRGDGAAVLVDFEEGTHLFMPPAWDLAFLVQRFCLRDTPSPSVARQRVAIVADAYGSPLPELAPIMRQVTWFTMATILDLRTNQGIVTPVEEYDKFVRLERQALAYEGVL